MNLKHDKSAIIAQGQELFRERGYYATGVNEILKSCQISKGVFYNYFSTKEDYLLQSVAYYSGQMDAFVESFTTDQEKRPIERLRALYSALMEIAEAEDCQKGCLVYNLSFEVAGSNMAVAEVLDKHFERWVTLVADCIEEGQRSGEITASQSAHHLANVLHTSINGAFGRVKAQRSVEPMKQILETMLDIMAA